jgi:hypothetical protein
VCYYVLPETPPICKCCKCIYMEMLDAVCVCVCLSGCNLLTRIDPRNSKEYQVNWVDIAYQNFSNVHIIKVGGESGRLRNDGRNFSNWYNTPCFFIFLEKRMPYSKKKRKASTWYTTLILSRRDSTFTAINQARTSMAIISLHVFQIYHMTLIRLSKLFVVGTLRKNVHYYSFNCVHCRKTL